MQIKRKYDRLFFRSEALRSAVDHVESVLLDAGQTIGYSGLTIQEGQDSISFDDARDGFEELLSIYKITNDWVYIVFGERNSLSINFTFQRVLGGAVTNVEVTGRNRTEINKVLRIFDKTNDKVTLGKPVQNKPKPVVFLGHGRSDHWIALKNHLQDKHKIDVIAYETGARSGHTIRDILDEMSQKATMAFLLHTAEDEQSNGSYNARPNVIHETGLFQGKLGFPRAVVILEDGCQEYSNLAGIQQIRYSKGNIKETYGDVLAAIKREFD